MQPSQRRWADWLRDLVSAKGESAVPKKLRWGSTSIVGNYRENNEDRCWTDASGRFFIVADGMGGQSAGERASAMAVEIVSAKLAQSVNFQGEPTPETAQAVEAAIHTANAEILAMSELDPELKNMGTTIAVLVAVQEAICVAHMGDSRIYLLRGGELKQLTVDHSIAQALAEAGTIAPEEVSSHRYKNVLYKYLGSKEGGGAIDPHWVPLQSGDRFLACSVGVTDGLSRDKLRLLLQESKDPQRTSEAVVQAALKGGSRDNITCVAIFVD